jgi:hypothetical protein
MMPQSAATLADPRHAQRESAGIPMDSKQSRNLAENNPADTPPYGPQQTAAEIPHSQKPVEPAGKPSQDPRPDQPNNVHPSFAPFTTADTGPVRPAPSEQDQAPVSSSASKRSLQPPDTETARKPIPGEHAAEAAPKQTEAQTMESDAPAGGSDGPPADLAFQVKLVATDSPHSLAAPIAPQAAASPAVNPASAAAGPDAQSPPPETADTTLANPNEQGGTAGGAEEDPAEDTRTRKAAQPAVSQVPAFPEPAIQPGTQPISSTLAPSGGVTTRRDTQPSPQGAPENGSETPAAKAAPQTDPGVKSPPLHDIQLRVDGADGRVNVRLVERAGEVRVDVRTSDSELSGQLRADLPSLTSKIEQAGFQAETWHPAPVAAAERERAVERSSSLQADPQSQQGQPDGREQQEDQREQQSRQAPNARKAEPGRKDFSWFFKSQE